MQCQPWQPRTGCLAHSGDFPLWWWFLVNDLYWRLTEALVSKLPHWQHARTGSSALFPEPSFIPILAVCPLPPWFCIPLIHSFVPSGFPYWGPAVFWNQGYSDEQSPTYGPCPCGVSYQVVGSQVFIMQSLKYMECGSCDAGCEW